MIAVFHPDDDHGPRMFRFDCNFMLNFLDKWLFECTRTEGSTYGQMSQWEVMRSGATQYFMTNWVVKICVQRKDVLWRVFIVSNLSHFLINPICIFIMDYKTLRTAMKRLVSRDYKTPRWMPRDQVSLTIFYCCGAWRKPTLVIKAHLYGKGVNSLSCSTLLLQMSFCHRRSVDKEVRVFPGCAKAVVMNDLLKLF